LPTSISRRTRDLAQQLAAGQPTAYDKVLTVQNYLRASIRYSRDIPAPPAGQDPVDWVLFNQREGYCNYYASAMAVMLRSLGIPTRMGVGFAQGALDLDTAQYRVIEGDAHTWPEVYFPDYGWVEFEPTASQPNVDRTAAAEANASPEELERAQPDPADAPERQDLLGRGEVGSPSGGLGSPRTWWLGTALIATAGLAVAWRVWRRQRREAEAQVTPAVSAYEHLARAAALVGLRLLPSWTPRERAAALSARLPLRRPEIDQITREYEIEIFSRSEQHAWMAHEAWRKMQPAVWWAIAQRLWDRGVGRR